MGMTRLILATRNAGKLTELKAILADAGLTHDLVGADAYPDIPDVKETGVTFAENALLKAHALAQATGLPAVADDSGLCVDVLGGAPGIFSARWAGRHGDDDANLALLLAQLGDISDEHRGAHFACAAALALPDGTERVVEGPAAGFTPARSRRHERVRVRPDPPAGGGDTDLRGAVGRGEERDQPSGEGVQGVGAGGPGVAGLKADTGTACESFDSQAVYCAAEGIRTLKPFHGPQILSLLRRLLRHRR